MASPSPAVLTLEDVRGIVEARYPSPLAAVARRCRVAPRADLGGRHKLLVDLFEAYLKFTCIVFLQEAKMLCPIIRERLPQKEKTLEFLKHPSTGGWASLLRALCEVDLSDLSGVWTPGILAWYRQARSPENQVPLNLLGQIEDLAFDRRSSTPHAEAINAFVTYRNKHLAHAASFTKEQLDRRLPLLEGAIAYLLRSATYLANMSVFFVERVEVLDNERWLVHARRLEAMGEEATELTTNAKLEKSEIYLSDTPSGELARPPIPLSPFLLWQVNPERKIRETFYFNDAWRTKLEYVSYESGCRYYHQELHAGFRDLITLKVVPGASEDAYALLSPDERTANAERLYKQARIHLEASRPEDAVECLEQSVAYERRAVSFLLMARAQQQLGDPTTVLLQALDTALELEPSNSEAAGFRSTVEQGTVEVVVKDVAPGPGHAPIRTILHALTPRRLRQYGLVWWCAITLGWYGVSALIEWLATGQPAALAPRVLQAIFVTGILLWIVVGRSLMERQRLPLSLQLQSMRLERFESWFDEQLEGVFWQLSEVDGRFAVGSAVQRYRPELWGWFATLVLLTTACFVLSGSYAVPFWLMGVRLLDYGLLMLFAYPGLRYIVRTTFFIYQVSTLSLKPALTTLNDDGVRSFGPLMVFNIGLGGLMTTSYWLLASLVVTMTVPLDLVFLAIFTLFALVGSIGMPMMLRRAMRESKSRAVHAFAEHIEKAFGRFLEHPAEDELKRYQWLLDHQRVIQGITTWPLSFTQTIVAVVGSNLIVLGVDVWYVGVRLGWWAHFIPTVVR